MGCSAVKVCYAECKRIEEQPADWVRFGAKMDLQKGSAYLSIPVPMSLARAMAPVRDHVERVSHVGIGKVLN